LNAKKNVSNNIISTLNPKNLFTVSNEIVSKFEKKKKSFKANHTEKANEHSAETLESAKSTTATSSPTQSEYIFTAFNTLLIDMLQLIYFILYRLK